MLRMCPMFLLLCSQEYPREYESLVCEGIQGPATLLSFHWPAVAQAQETGMVNHDDLYDKNQSCLFSFKICFTR